MRLVPHLAAVIVGGALLVGLPAAARAQHGHGGGHAGGAHYAGAHYGGAYHGGYYGGHYGYSGVGIYGGFYYPGYAGYGGYYPSVSLYSGPGYSGYYPYAAPVVSAPPVLAPVDPAPAVSPPAPAADPGANAARIRVVLPDPQGEVWFNGQKTGSTGASRTFVSPELDPGKENTYKLTAAWHEGGRLVTQERTVRVAPGQSYTVDFTRPPADEPLPPPAGKP